MLLGKRDNGESSSLYERFTINPCFKERLASTVLAETYRALG